MKRLTVLTLIAVGLLVAAVAVAGSPYGKKAAAAPAMKTYLLLVPHTEAGCLTALDNFEASKVLGEFDFGCMSGDHTGYRIVTAKSPEAALTQVPEQEREEAKAVELHKFTAAELRQHHEKTSKHSH